MAWYDPDEIKAQALADKTQPEFDPELEPDSVDEIKEETQEFLDSLTGSLNRIRQTLGIGGGS